MNKRLIEIIRSGEHVEETEESVAEKHNESE